jgi:SAM-dependent methyltransferase
MPLGILSLPKTESEALTMSKHKIDLRRCAACGHVYHTEFDPKKIIYDDDSTMVFNKGPAWLQHQEGLAQKWISCFNLYGKKILEIGCGEGGFLEHFQKANCQCFGFEPGRDGETAAQRGIKVYRENFEASALATLQPDAVICRHVLEHLCEPLDLLKGIALTSAEMGKDIVVLAEVPRIDKALEQRRISDFFYEHVSHFTDDSFRTLFETAGFEVLDLESRYGDEVVVVAAKPRKTLQIKAFKDASEQFSDSVHRQVVSANQQIAEWKRTKKTIALWGSAGKAAALINMLGFTKEIFPIVVDSDPNKFGHFVPGTGQEIRTPAYLKDHPVDGILICTNWRARDIETEIRSKHQLTMPLYIQLDEKIVELTPNLNT